MRSRLLALALAPPVTPTPTPSGGSGTGGSGGGGGIDPGGIISQLPDGTGPVATVIVVFLLFLASLVPVAAKFIPDRPAKPAVAGETHAPTRADLDALQSSLERIERLETELGEAKTDVRRIQARYEAEVEKNHDLDKQLAAASQRLDRMAEDLAEARAQLAFVLGPLHAEPATAYPRPSGRRPPPRRPPRRPPPITEADEAPTDPIRPDSRSAP